MATYIIPTLNDGLEIKDPIIAKVGIYYDSDMIGLNLVDLTVFIETTVVKYGVSLFSVTVVKIPDDTDDLLALAQTEFDARYKVV